MSDPQSVHSEAHLDDGEPGEPCRPSESEESYEAEAHAIDAKAENSSESEELQKCPWEKNSILDVMVKELKMEFAQMCITLPAEDAQKDIKYFETVRISNVEKNKYLRSTEAGQPRELEMAKTGTFFDEFSERDWIIVPKKELPASRFVRDGDEVYLVHAGTGTYLQSGVNQHQLYSQKAKCVWNDGKDSLWKIQSHGCTGVLSDGCQIMLKNGDGYFTHWDDLFGNTSFVGTHYEEAGAPLAGDPWMVVSKRKGDEISNLRKECQQFLKYFGKGEKKDAEIAMLREDIEALQLVNAALLNQTSIVPNNQLSASIKEKVNVDLKQVIVPKALFIAMASGLGLLIIILIIVGVIWCVQRWKTSKKALLHGFDARDDVGIGVIRHTVDIPNGGKIDAPDDVNIGIVRHSIVRPDELKVAEKPKLKAMDKWKSIKMTKKADSSEELFDSISVDEGAETGTVPTKN